MTPSPSCAEAAAPPPRHSELLRAASMAPVLCCPTVCALSAVAITACHRAGIGGSVRGGLRAGGGVPLRGYARGHDGRGVCAV
jgi:hypothetical protein